MEKKTKAQHSPECSEISVSSSAEYKLEPASVKGDGNILTVEILSSGVDNLKVPRFLDYNDKHKKLNGDGVVTLMRQETHIPDESTDTLADRTYQATYSWCGIIREDVIGTHKDTHTPSSHSRYQINRSPDSV